MQVRKADFAGSWYPRKAAACQEQIRLFLSSADEDVDAGPNWLGGVVPHAGWFYSGQIACRVISCLQETEPLDLVVVFGMHLNPSSPNHMMPEGAWETPFGELPVDTGLAGHLQRCFRFRLETPEHHMPDNTIELQLPFIKYLLKPQTVLGLGLPPAPGSLDIAKAVVEWAQANSRRLKVIGSTDLTHYGSNYGFTPHGSGSSALNWVREHNDRRVIEAMLAIDSRKVIEEGLRNQNACCSGAAAAAVEAARHIGAVRSHLIGYASSYDKSPGESFVGYAGVVFGS